MSQALETTATVESSSNEFEDRRGGAVTSGSVGVERRQFADGHDELSPEALELASAIDEYKLRHRRRFITHEEMLHVVKTLGYSRK